MKPSSAQSRSSWKPFVATLAGTGLFIGLTAAIAWYGPDPGQVIRVSAADVPDFSHLSSNEVVEQLRKISTEQSANLDVVALDLSEAGQLTITLASAEDRFSSTQVMPLAELDRFLYAEQAVKGRRIWSIQLYCASYQSCIATTNSHNAGEFTQNASNVLYLQPNSEVKTVLGLLDQLLALHGAQSTIDTRKNTIRISEEYWRQLKEN